MPKHILCADDSVTMQKVVAITFAHTDFQVQAARSADEALSLARQHRPDLILADAVMPGKTGYDLCHALKSDAALRAVPVVILCGNSQPFDEARGRQVGADGHLAKPWDTQVFVEKIGEILGRAASHGVASPTAGMGPATSPLRPTAPPASPPAPRPTMTGAGLPPPRPTTAPVPATPNLGMRGPAPSAPSAPAPSTPVRPAPPPAMAAPLPGALPKPPAGLPRPPLIRGAPIAGRPRPVAPAPAGGLGAAAARPMPQSTPTPAPAPPPVAARANPRSATIMGMPAMHLPPALGGTPVPQPPPQAPAPVAPSAAPTAPGPTRQPPPAMPARPAPAPLPGSDALAKAAQRVAAAGMLASQQAAVAQGLDPRGVEYDAIAKLSREVIERIAWEVVPELAEIILREHVERLKKQ